MKKFIIPVFAAILLFGFFGQASADAILIGFYDKNDPSQGNADLSQFQDTVSSWYNTRYASDWGTDWTISFYTKVDGSNGSNNGLTISSASDKHSGQWSTDETINLFSVKAGNGYALYWLEGGASSGDWTTSGLLNGGGKEPAISHFSTWTVSGASTLPNIPVPEPGTLILLGIGIITVIGWARKTA